MRQMPEDRTHCSNFSSFPWSGSIEYSTSNATSTSGGQNVSAMIATKSQSDYTAGVWPSREPPNHVHRAPSPRHRGCRLQVLHPQPNRAAQVLRAPALRELGPSWLPLARQGASPPQFSPCSWVDLERRVYLRITELQHESVLLRTPGVTARKKNVLTVFSQQKIALNSKFCRPMDT